VVGKRCEQIFAGGAMPYLHDCVGVMVLELVIAFGDITAKRFPSIRLFSRCTFAKERPGRSATSTCWRVVPHTHNNVVSIHTPTHDLFSPNACTGRDLARNSYYRMVARWLEDLEAMMEDGHFRYIRCIVGECIINRAPLKTEVAVNCNRSKVITYNV
jgi:hypothetical protein